MTKVKICGLRRVEDALVAVESGASMLGFVFAPSRRRVEPGEAREMITRVRREGAAAAVGIFVDASPDHMNEIARECGLDYIQLSGHEDNATIRALDVPAIKVLHVGPGDTPERLAARAEATEAPYLLLDTARAGSYGGTGTAFDWNRVPALPRPFLLAGGLHAGNVSEAIRMVHPWGVDVSSGVETEGGKNPGKIREFVRAALQTG